MRYFSNPLPITLNEKAAVIPGLPALYNPDPYVLKYNGEYYSYATSRNGVVVLHAKDLVNWTHLGYALQQEGEIEYWAPAVFYENGLFYMYYSSLNAKEDDVHYEFLKVAVSDKPEGPFEYKTTLFDTFSIDAHVVRDTDGQLILFYSTNETCGIDAYRPGTVILADRLLDPLTLEGNPRLIIKPTLDEEIFAENRFGDGRDWHTIEGAFHFRRRNKHYVMYSGNAFTREFYYIGYASAEHREGRSILDLDWVKYPDEDAYEPLLKKNEMVEGVGHNSVAQAPNNVDQWIVYHGRRVAKAVGEEGELRQMRIDPILWEQDRMWVPGPSYDEQAAPALPSFRDLFDRPDQSGLGARWRERTGEWSVRCEEALQASRVGKGMALTAESYAYAVFEANVRWERSHMGGLYGVVLHWKDEANYTEILLDAGKRIVTAVETSNGIKQSGEVYALSAEFRFDVYHRLLLTITGSYIQVNVDEMTVLTHVSRRRQGRLGLSTHYTSAAFDGIAVTRHFALHDGSDTGSLDVIRAEKGNWRLEKGALLGVPEMGEARLHIEAPAGTTGSVCRFDVAYKGSADKDGVVVTLGGMGEAAVPIRLPVQHANRNNAQTVAISHSNGLVQIRLGKETVAAYVAEGDWTSLGIHSDCAIRIKALEWTERVEG